MRRLSEWELRLLLRQAKSEVGGHRKNVQKCTKFRKFLRQGRSSELDMNYNSVRSTMIDRLGFSMGA